MTREATRVVGNSGNVTTIPDSIDAAVAELTGLGELITASEWRKAAIVATFVVVSDDGVNFVVTESGEGARTSTLSSVQFAALGISGLKSKDTVRRYAKAWADAGQPRPTPGQNVELPTTPFREIAAPSKTSGQFSGTDAAVRENTGSIARVLGDPATVARTLVRMTPEAKSALIEGLAAEVDEDGENVGAAALMSGVAAQNPGVPFEPLLREAQEQNERTTTDKRYEDIKREHDNRDREGSAENLLDIAAVVLRANVLMKAALRECKGVDNRSDQDNVTIAKLGKSVEHLAQMLQATVTGNLDIDWDSELASELAKEGNR